MHLKVAADMRMHAFSDDQDGNLASSALPFVFATIGMGLLGVGALLSIMPVVFAGAGLTVLAFATYLIASALDRQDRRKEDERERAAAAHAAFRHEQAQAAAAPRNPLADQAVAALTGEGRGGIYPPLPSQMEQGEIHTPGHAAPRAHAAQESWEPGAKVGPQGWDDPPQEEIVEFEEVPQVMTQTTSGGGVRVAATQRPATNGHRVAPAQPDPTEDPHDFRIWPGAKDVDSWSSFTGEHRPRPTRYTEEDLKRSMDERRRQYADRLPTVGAILADVSMKETERERLQREATRGKCSKCASIIWAPKKRPIVLKCPGCGHKAKLY